VTSPPEIFINLVRLSPLVSRLEKILNLLPPGRRAKALARARPEDRLRSAVGSLLLRLKLGVESDSDLTYGSRGRPALAGGGPLFSLSHSGDWAALSVGFVDHGLDLEKIRTKEVPPALSDFALSPTESELFERGGRDPGLFTILWTLKESFLKAVGEGIGLRPVAVPVRPLDADGSRLVDGRRWFFRTFELDGAVASLAAADEAPTVRLEEIEPFVASSAIASIERSGASCPPPRSDRSKPRLARSPHHL
jgi:4'-phosphopantetheinyl transferase